VANYEIEADAPKLSLPGCAKAYNSRRGSHRKARERRTDLRNEFLKKPERS
jgi:hypothetical protein